MRWNHEVKIKHLLTEDMHHAGVQRDMNAIADILEADPQFKGFRKTLAKFRGIPEGDDVFGPDDYANRLLDRMYDYADKYRIWIA